MKLRLFLLLLLLTALAVSGCQTSNYPYTYMSRPPIAQIVGRTVTIHYSTDTIYGESFYHAMIHARLHRNKLEVFFERASPGGAQSPISTELKVALPQGVAPESVEVVWLNPDGSLVPISTIRTP